MSIKRKLTLIIMGLSLTAVMLTVVAITAYLIYDMRRSNAQELAVTATLLGDRNSAALTFLDNKHAQQNLELFRLDPSVMQACIYDTHGVLFAGYQAGKQACPPRASAVPHRLPDMLTVFQSIQHNGESIGSVFIVTNTREMDAYVGKILQISGTVALLVLAVTWLCAVYFQRTISGPILELAATAQSITAHRDYTLAAKAAYPDETGVLARAFNAMLGEVRKRDRELTQANETLESKVIERTHQLEEALHKAEAASAAKSEFLRNMSHEFRTPLHAITNFSAFGINEYDHADRGQLKQYFELIQKGTKRLSRLVNEVLDLSKLERGAPALALKEGDMHELTARAAEIMRSLMQEKNITLHFDRAEEAFTMCDHDKIVQVLINLLGNAIKFSPAGGRVTVQSRTADIGGERHAVLSVTDEGIGIPEDEREVIFESFRQSSRTNTGAGGTGLGLAICRGIVEAHGGRIWAENNARGPGACVTFTVPCQPKETARSIPRSPREESHETAA